MFFFVVAYLLFSLSCFWNQINQQQQKESIYIDIYILICTHKLSDWNVNLYSIYLYLIYLSLYCNLTCCMYRTKNTISQRKAINYYILYTYVYHVDDVAIHVSHSTSCILSFFISLGTFYKSLTTNYPSSSSFVHTIFFLIHYTAFPFKHQSFDT